MVMVIMYPQKAEHSDVICTVEGIIEWEIKHVHQHGKDEARQSDVRNRQADIEEIIAPGRPVGR